MPELFAAATVEREDLDDGAFVLRSPVPLTGSARAVGDWLVRWAGEAPERTAFGERPAPGAPWRTITYSEMLRQVRSAATWLLKHGAHVDRPVVILSENSIDHAVMNLAAMHVGVPTASISPAYSLMSADHARLGEMVRLIGPAVVMASDGAAFGAALAAIAGDHDAALVASQPADGMTPFSDIVATDAGPEVDAAFARVGPDTVARYLFTSGSTGMPKAVINTQRMLTAPQESRVLCWPFLQGEPPVIVDWLPWSHTFGANHNVNMILRGGGTLWIDDGRPAPPLIGRTAENIKEIRPNLCFNVPRGFDMLAAAMQEDADLRDAFFDMKLLFYAGAALPQSVWEALEDLSQRTIGRTMPMVAAWGMTETAPLATDCHFQAGRSGNIGLPVPGVDIKLVPVDDRLEIRVRGPNVTPGYFRNPEATAAAFDEDGYYRTGDAVRLADPQDPSQGMFFDGRLAENFKLTSGTWVAVGALRLAGIDALQPVAQDIAVTGHDRDRVGFLIVPNVPACRQIAGADVQAGLADVMAHPAVVASVARGLAALKAAAGGSSSRHGARARLLIAPPDPDAGEITDKGYLNQRAVLANRAGDVEALYGDDPAGYILPDS